MFGGQYLLVVAESSSLVSKSQSLSMPSDVFESILQSSMFESPLTQYARLNKRYWVWGAGGKGVLLMFHLSKKKFEKLNMPIAMVDINPGKQNRFTVSSAVPIVPPSKFLKRFVTMTSYL